MVSKNARGRRVVARYFTFLGVLHVLAFLHLKMLGMFTKRSFQTTIGILMFVCVMPSYTKCRHPEDTLNST
jgi:hypothetical protein